MKLNNVHDEVRGQVAADKKATFVAHVYDGLFTISHYSRDEVRGGHYTLLRCKPTKALASAQLIDREILTVIADFTDLQARLVKVVERAIKDADGRLDPSLIIVVHPDKRGEAKLRTWGNEARLRFVSIFAPRSNGTAPEVYRHQLIQDLFALDPFQVTGPVSSDHDFFGRGSLAQDLLRQLQNGRIRSLFGIRKSGKTSLVNRIIQIAREAGSPAVAMLDCSVEAFYMLNDKMAMRAIAFLVAQAQSDGYARLDDDFIRTLNDAKVAAPPSIGRISGAIPVVLVLDEVDYITPFSPVPNGWTKHFNAFWREFRAEVQEAQRNGTQLAILVSGVSSKAFRTAAFDGVENSALHFVPEEYLAPFARQASTSMLRELGKRCGLQFENDARELIAGACGDHPFWMRMAGSFLHHRLSMAERPMLVTRATVEPLLDEFVESEGADIARLALENFRRVYPEMFQLLAKAESKPMEPALGRPLERYGLLRRERQHLVISSSMVRAGLLYASPLEEDTSVSPAVSGPSQASDDLRMEDSAWAEELASIGRRRNILERRLRDLIRFVLKAALPKTDAWHAVVLKAVPEKRRAELGSYAPDLLMGKLYWLELRAVIIREWVYFEKIIGDKNRLQLSMELLNERPDTHAKDVDAADIALQRRELTWLEERILT